MNEEYERLVRNLNAVLDAGGANENSPLADTAAMLGEMAEGCLCRGWISISASQPAKNERVLVTYGQWIEIGYFSNGNWHADVDGDPLPITHWQPLPEPAAMSEQLP